MAKRAPRPRRPTVPSRLRGLGGYADLVSALGGGGERDLATMAALLGYERGREPPPSRGPKPIVSARESGNDVPAPAADVEIVSRPPLDTPFWRVVSREFAAPLEVIASTAPDLWPGLDERTPPPRALNRWRFMVPRLRGCLTRRVEGRHPDVGAMIHQLGKGRMLERVPRLKRRRWGEAVQIILDRGQRLTPFWADHDRAARCLAALFPRHRVETALVLDGPCRPRIFAPDGSSRDYRLPAAGTLVVVLGDLGCLADQPRAPLEEWEAFGRRLVAAGCRAAALTPCPPSRWRPELSPSWTLVPWERRAGGRRPDDAEREALAERLLALLSPAIRIEPGLLRDMRLLLGERADAGTEADVWRHPALSGHSSVAATFDPQAIARWREAFSQLPAALRAAALERLRRWRGGDLAAEIWFEEVLSLDATVIEALPAEQRALIRDGDLPRARRFWTSEAPALVETSAGARRWYFGVHTRASPHYHAQPDQALRAAQYRMFLSILGDGGIEPPPGFDPALIPGDPAREREVEVRQVADRVEVAGPGGGARAGSPLAVLRATDVIALETGAPVDRAAFWKTGVPPSWAEDWGDDEFGAWTTFRIDDVTQRLRWIPPGHFLMGSPEDEPGRWKDEGPQHRVSISRGFWLMETPCTQALWRTVMGDNPSAFISPDRPVEQVSWVDIQGFLARLNERAPDLALILPTEAEWEYACRAGTTTALYSGDIAILGSRNAPALDPIAWYGGNSGVDFDLKNGEGSKDWSDKQYPHKRAGTRPVGQKRPNGWGLHDMLGNVWEWCRDGWRDYRAEAETDPTGPLESGADRVLRGGSWFNGARNVRAADRARFLPDLRFNYLGFRYARVQDVSPAGGRVAEPADPVQARLAERRVAQGPASGAVLRLDRGAAVDRCPLPRSPTFELRSDRERLTFERINRPDWADAIGRDRYGLWARIAVEAADGAAPVTQRLRWLPPGRFLMGSPESEPERLDREGPQHPVTLSRGFWLMDTVCTQALWQAVMGDNPSRFKTSPDLPVDTISWNDVQDFLSRINRSLPGLELTLPTEAQWEYACRAGTNTPFSFGATATPAQVNYDGDYPYAGGEKGEYRNKTIPVTCLPANPWGLHAMHGNVWEWCLDGRRRYRAEGETDPVGPLESGAARVLRGGSWSDFARRVRAAYRYQSHPDSRVIIVGFRCARVQS